MLSFRRRRLAQAPGRPRKWQRRNPLIVIVGETALEIWLEFRGTAAHVPGAVLALRAQQKLHALLIDRVEADRKPDSFSA